MNRKVPTSSSASAPSSWFQVTQGRAQESFMAGCLVHSFGIFKQELPYLVSEYSFIPLKFHLVVFGARKCV